jgi:hypothetical protein
MGLRGSLRWLGAELWQRLAPLRGMLRDVSSIGHVQKADAPCFAKAASQLSWRAC